MRDVKIRRFYYYFLNPWKLRIQKRYSRSTFFDVRLEVLNKKLIITSFEEIRRFFRF